MGSQEGLTTNSGGLGIGRFAVEPRPAWSRFDPAQVNSATAIGWKSHTLPPCRIYPLNRHKVQVLAATSNTAISLARWESGPPSDTEWQLEIIGLSRGANMS